MMPLGLHFRLVLKEDLESLKMKAHEYGAYRAEVIPIDKIVMDPRVRLKCLVPVCENYGKNRMCPPNLPSLDEFGKALLRYRHAIIIQFKIGLNQAEVQERFAAKDLQALVLDEGYSQVMKETMCNMLEVLGKLERDALYMGYRFAAGLSGGACALCVECVGPGEDKRCLHPFKARPSIEAMGIDVVATAEMAGLKVQFPAETEAVWTGMLLVD